jgi:hypothetical protein
VAISADGTTVVAGAERKDTNGSTGGTSQGTAYVFVRPGAAWTSANQNARLTASDGADSDNLGSSVAVSSDGSTIVAGALNNDTNGLGTGSGQGAAYVFVRSGAIWSNGAQTSKLTAGDGAQSDALGYAVAISASGDTVAAGAPNADTNGGTAGTHQGAVYLFARPGAVWGRDLCRARRLFSRRRNRSQRQRTSFLSTPILLLPAARSPFRLR